MSGTKRRFSAGAGLAVLALCVGLPSLAGADAPELINIQGKLRDNDNRALEGPVDIVLSVHDAATSGNQTYGETHANVSLSAGVFSVLLGGGTDASGQLDSSILASGEYYLELGVGTGGDPASVETLSPRQRLVSAPYALHAATATAAEAALNSDSVDGLDSTQLQRAIVGGSCSGEDYVKSIGTDGSVVCETPPGSGQVADEAVGREEIAGSEVGLYRQSNPACDQSTDGQLTTQSSCSARTCLIPGPVPRFGRIRCGTPSECRVTVPPIARCGNTRLGYMLSPDIQ